MGSPCVRHLRRRSAIEPVIGHMKTREPAGDVGNATLITVGHNLRVVLASPRILSPDRRRAIAHLRRPL